MTRLLKKAAVPDFKHHSSGPKYLPIALCCMCFALIGCPPPEKEPIWKDLKIGDLAPRRDGKPQRSRLLETTNFNLYVFEMPSDNIDKLDDVRKTMFTKNLRYQSSHSFSENSFSVHFGQIRMWEEIFTSILAAGAKQVNKASLMLGDELPETISIARIDSPRTIFFTSTYGSREGVNVGSGILALRLKTQKIPSLRGVCNVTAYPVYSPPMITSTIPLLNVRTQRREFPFSAAAFELRMGPGDFILFGPKEYVSDQTALGGMFFSNPEGSLFFSETERTTFEPKPTVRIFLLVCTRTNY